MGAMFLQSNYREMNSLASIAKSIKLEISIVTIQLNIFSEGQK